MIHRTPPTDPSVRRTLGHRAVRLLLVVAAGLISRRYPIGLPLYDENLGDGLYAAAVYLALGLTAPRWPPLLLAGAAFAVCLAVEGFQLTGIPARYADFPPVRWLLGTHFAWVDVLCYFVGAACLAAIERAGGAHGRQEPGPPRQNDADQLY